MARSSRRGPTRSCSRRMASMQTCITASLQGELSWRKRCSIGRVLIGLFDIYTKKRVSSTLAFSCQRIFCWRKEDEDRQTRDDAMKVVAAASRHKDDRSFLHCTGFIAKLDNSLTADNVIDLILSVGLLWVDGARR